MDRKNEETVCRRFNRVMDKITGGGAVTEYFTIRESLEERCYTRALSSDEDQGIDSKLDGIVTSAVIRLTEGDPNLPKIPSAELECGKSFLPKVYALAASKRAETEAIIRTIIE